MLKGVEQVVSITAPAARVEDNPFILFTPYTRGRVWMEIIITPISDMAPQTYLIALPQPKSYWTLRMFTEWLEQSVDRIVWAKPLNRLVLDCEYLTPFKTKK